MSLPICNNSSEYTKVPDWHHFSENLFFYNKYFLYLVDENHLYFIYFLTITTTKNTIISFIWSSSNPAQACHVSRTERDRLRILDSSQLITLTLSWTLNDVNPPPGFNHLVGSTGSQLQRRRLFLGSVWGLCLISSLNSTTGNRSFWPILPFRSHGSIILACIPSTPWRRRTWRVAVS